jgi:hypothetical protein
MQKSNLECKSHTTQGKLFFSPWMGQHFLAAVESARAEWRRACCGRAESERERENVIPFFLLKKLKFHFLSGQEK